MLKCVFRKLELGTKLQCTSSCLSHMSAPLSICAIPIRSSLPGDRVQNLNTVSRWAFGWVEIVLSDWLGYISGSFCSLVWKIMPQNDFITVLNSLQGSFGNSTQCTGATPNTLLQSYPFPQPDPLDEWLTTLTLLHSMPFHHLILYPVFSAGERHPCSSIYCSVRPLT